MSSLENRLNQNRHSASFRDPSGFVFWHEGKIRRQVNPVYFDTYHELISSGLYKALIDREMIIPHREISRDDDCIVLEPEHIPFLSYPYEWSFDQYKESALLTLDIARKAMDYNMILKDASAFNIQFLGGKPTLIDTLSFIHYNEGEPWIAYGQFCRHFLAPLWLHAYVDPRCILLLRDFIDGIPLDYASNILGRLPRLKFMELVHIRAHAKMQRKLGNDKGHSKKGRTMSQNALLGLLDNLRTGISRLKWKPGDTEWGEYYSNTNYSETAESSKAERVDTILGKHLPESVWDIGANDGKYSRIAARHSRELVSMDIDPVAVNINYRKSRNENYDNILTLRMDVCNPSPALGWNLDERESLMARGPADCVMALAVVHHLCIANNISLKRLANFFEKVTEKMLVIEFVPKDDSQAAFMLASREDVFDDYNIDNLKRVFSEKFTLTAEYPIVDSKRTLLLFSKQ